VLDLLFLYNSAGLMKPPHIGSLLLGLIPFIAICLTVPLWDRIYPIVFGLPFNFFWLIAWLVITPLCMWAACVLEQRTPESHDEGGER
jgi:hypothetical protein